MEKITTNYHWRKIEYLEDENEDDGELYPGFRYKGNVYFLNEALIINDDYWHGTIQLNNFGGLLVKISDDGDSIQIGSNY